MSDVQVKHYVKNVCSKDNGTGISRSLECTPLLMVQDYSFFSSQFNLSYADVETKKIHRILGYGNLLLFGTLAGKVQVYIDGTFNIVPYPFYQYLIVMMYDVQA